MPTIVFYLPHYDTKIRYEEEIDKINKKNIKKVEQTFLSKFGKSQQDKSGQFRGGAGDKRYKYVYGWKKGTIAGIRYKIYTKAIKQYIRKGKPVKEHKRLTIGRWTEKQKSKAILLKQQGLKYTDIAKQLNKTYHSVRSKFTKELNRR